VGVAGSGGRARGRVPGSRRRVPVSRGLIRTLRGLTRIAEVGAKNRTQIVREMPRVRDIPPPRRSESAAGGAMQRLFAWPYRAILAFLVWTGIRPWQLTLLSLAFTALTGVLIVEGDWFVAAFALFLASLCDVFDGS